MNTARAVVSLAVSCILLTTLASGPLVAAVDFTNDERPAYGEGTVTVGNATFPGEATLEAASYGQKGYYLTVPPATASLEAVTGTPTLVYRLQIDELGYTRSTAHFLDSSTPSPVRVTIESDSFPPGEIDAASYEGTLSLVTYDSSGRTVAGERNVTVEVRE